MVSTLFHRAFALALLLFLPLFAGCTETTSPSIDFVVPFFHVGDRYSFIGDGWVGYGMAYAPDLHYRDGGREKYEPMLATDRTMDMRVLEMPDALTRNGSRQPSYAVEYRMHVDGEWEHFFTEHHSKATNLPLARTRERAAGQSNGPAGYTYFGSCAFGVLDTSLFQGMALKPGKSTVQLRDLSEDECRLHRTYELDIRQTDHDTVRMGVDVLVPSWDDWPRTHVEYTWKRGVPVPVERVIEGPMWNGSMRLDDWRPGAGPRLEPDASLASRAFVPWGVVSWDRLKPAGDLPTRLPFDQAYRTAREDATTSTYLEGHPEARLVEWDWEVGLPIARGGYDGETWHFVFSDLDTAACVYVEAEWLRIAPVVNTTRSRPYQCAANDWSIYGSPDGLPDRLALDITGALRVAEDCKVPVDGFAMTLRDAVAMTIQWPFLDEDGRPTPAAGEPNLLRLNAQDGQVRMYNAPRGDRDPCPQMVPEAIR